MNVYKWYAVSRWLYLHHVPFLPYCIKIFIRIIWAAVIPYQADIGKGTTFCYQGLGIVIHNRCILGENCHISQNVTLGGTSGLWDVPILGDEVEIGAHAQIIGPVRIGSRVIIGAGAVVLCDLPDDCVAVGMPARIVKIREHDET